MLPQPQSVDSASLNELNIDLLTYIEVSLLLVTPLTSLTAIGSYWVTFFQLCWLVLVPHGNRISRQVFVWELCRHPS